MLRLPPWGGAGLSSPPPTFLAVSPGHIWPTCGSHYGPPGLSAAIFIHRMGVAWGMVSPDAGAARSRSGSETRFPCKGGGGH